MSREFKKIIRSAIYIVDGEYSEELGSAFMGEVKQIIVMPESSDTKYTFALIDEDNMPIFMQTTVGPLVSENLDIPLYPGMKKFVITGATKNDLFRVKMIYEL